MKLPSISRSGAGFHRKKVKLDDKDNDEDKEEEAEEKVPVKKSMQVYSHATLNMTDLI